MLCSNPDKINTITPITTEKVLIVPDIYLLDVSTARYIIIPQQNDKSAILYQEYVTFRANKFTDSACKFGITNLKGRQIIAHPIKLKIQIRIISL